MNAQDTPSSLPVVPRAFAMRFSLTRHGARLARLLAVQQLEAWGIPYGSTAADTVALLIGELAANVVTHGHVPGRDFHLGLTLDPAAGTARIEVSDARDECLPVRTPPREGATSGHGLLLVEELATKGGVAERSVGKTVWAECRLNCEYSAAYSP